MDPYSTATWGLFITCYVNASLCCFLPIFANPGQFIINTNELRPDNLLFSSICRLHPNSIISNGALPTVHRHMEAQKVIHWDINSSNQGLKSGTGFLVEHNTSFCGFTIVLAIDSDVNMSWITMWISENAFNNQYHFLKSNTLKNLTITRGDFMKYLFK